jgi:hypothetical protein
VIRPSLALAALALQGYVRAITLLHDRGFELPIHGDGIPARQSGSHGQVVRLKWRLEGPRWRLELHDRLQVRVASETAGQQVLGFGIGAEPERLVNLRTVLLERQRVQAWHDVDRLSLTLLTGPVDLTLGRQAITWGTATLFPVADLWAAFSPFEQDTEEKPGIDAARALLYPASGTELDLVLGYRGTLEDLSAGARVTINRPRTDLWAGAGKFWRQLMAMGGVTILGDHSRWRAEAVLPWDLDDRAFQQPRVTVGADRLGSSRIFGAEYHYNGIGRARPEDYVEALGDPRLRRGESYYLGRHYAGLTGTWSPDRENRLTVALNALANLGDASMALSPAFSYDVGQSARLSIGGLFSFGDPPHVTAAPPSLRPASEFGMYGDAVFTLLAIYF